MKRSIIIIVLISLLLFSLTITGCRIGEDKEIIGGLCSNNCINIPNCIVSNCSCLASTLPRPLQADDFSISAVEICKNSQGTGKNGYVTVMVSIANGANIDYVFGTFIYQLSFKINVYDDGVLVGSAIVARTEEQIEELTQIVYDGIAPALSTVTQRVYTEYFNVAIDDYLAGNYTCSIEWIEGVVA